MLQIWGGLFYLSNKVFFSIAETKAGELKRKLKLIGWVVYILGVPAWIIILMGGKNWIGASIEVGGVPAMLLGLYNTYYREQRQSRLLNQFASYCTYFALIVGISYSVIEFGGLVKLSQLFEIGTTIGFLLGSYYLAKNDRKGWLFFMLMNLCMAMLMMLDGKYLLVCQQLLSLCFVIYGYNRSGRNVIEVSS